MITRTPVPVTRRVYMVLSGEDAMHAQRQADRYGDRYAYTCHGCNTKIGAGQRWTQLRGTTANDYDVWCQSCTRHIPNS